LGRLADVGLGGHGDVLRGNRGDAAGIELGSSFIERITVNAGTARFCLIAVHPAWLAGWAHRRPIGSGRGGAVVVLRARESLCTW